MLKIIICSILLFSLTKTSSAQSLTDIDGNTYPTITIGTQVWMGQNLKTTRFLNGDSIPTTLLFTTNDPTSLYQWAYDDDTANIPTYGRLYTWYVATDSRHICPIGWHMPDNSEITTLSTYLGGDSAAGYKMKETGIAHWLATDASVTNSSTFTGLPGGFRGNGSGFINMGTVADFWSATPFGSISSFQRGNLFRLEAANGVMARSVATANCGFSVRCLRDAPAKVKSSGIPFRLNIFPNPAQDKMTITLPHAGNYRLRLYTSSGVIALEQSFTKQTIIEIGFMPSGQYWLEVSDGINAVTEGVFKE